MKVAVSLVTLCSICLAWPAAARAQPAPRARVAQVEDPEVALVLEREDDELPPARSEREANEDVYVEVLGPATKLSVRRAREGAAAERSGGTTAVGRDMAVGGALLTAVGSFGLALGMIGLLTAGTHEECERDPWAELGEGIAIAVEGGGGQDPLDVEPAYRCTEVPDSTLGATVATGLGAAAMTAGIILLALGAQRSPTENNDQSTTAQPYVSFVEDGAVAGVLLRR